MSTSDAMNGAGQRANPLAAADGDQRVDSEYLKANRPRLFSTKGRIGRLRYQAYQLAGLALVIPSALILGLIGGFLRAYSETAAYVIAMLVIAPTLAFFVTLAMRRSRDMGWRPWTGLIAVFVPFAGLIWMLKPGTRGDNAFGPPPPPNSLVVKICGVLMPVLCVLLVLLPMATAYQGYIERARAAQLEAP